MESRYKMSNSTKKILVTGGAGYIGASVCSALIDAGWAPVILDNLCQGSRSFTEGRIFYEGDIADRHLMNKIFKEQGPLYGAIHCAALIVVPESVSSPETYYRENVSKSIEFFAALRDIGCNRIVFSSSAAIYDVVDGFKVSECSPLNPLSPYSRTKFMIEMVLKDFCNAYPLKGIALRYFNPIGADPNYRTGAYVQSPTHILGKLVCVANGIIPEFEITGTQWPTRDGTGIRDYIHVWDLAKAHVKAIENFDHAFNVQNQYLSDTQSYKVINLGTGSGVTVREFVTAFERVLQKQINKKESPARPGDVAGSFASCEKALQLIKWKAELSIEDGIRDALAWAKKWTQNIKRN